MTPLSLVLSLGVLLMLAIRWGCQTLPAEHWQILASVPRAKDGDGTWRGTNLTYYGLLLACATLFSTGLFLWLLASVGIATSTALLILGSVMAIGVPAAKLVALIVERRRHTFTVGGASFVGFLAAPGIVYAATSLTGTPHPERALGPTLAALAVAFLFGEGLGRLGCISFGCCYGRRVDALTPRWRRVFEPRFHFAFHGATKKACYDSGLEGVKVVPVQALTSTCYVLAGLLGLYLFLLGHSVAAFLVATLVGQGWRVASEALRSDDRGAGKLSKYQWMGLLAMAYALALATFVPPSSGRPVRWLDGLLALWSPDVILTLQALFAIVLIVTGWSTVTGSSLSFHVKREAPAEEPGAAPAPLHRSPPAARPSVAAASAPGSPPPALGRRGAARRRRSATTAATCAAPRASTPSV